MKPRRPLAYCFMVPLLLTMVPTGVIKGQGTEFGVSIGLQLSDDDTDGYGSTRGRFEVVVQRPLVSRLQVRGGLAGSLIGPPPCPAPPGFDGEWDIHVGKSVEGHLDLGLALPIGPMFSLEPFVGTGARYLTEGKTNDPSPLAYALPSSTRMFVSGGTTAYARVTDTLRVFTRLRFSRHFIGAQTLNHSSGQSLEHDVPDLDTASLMAGLALRF